MKLCQIKWGNPGNGLNNSASMKGQGNQKAIVMDMGEMKWQQGPS
jgi:hypothetical protein